MRAMWGYRWWVAGFAVIAAIAAYSVSTTFSKTYTASTLTQVESGLSISGQYVDQDTLLQLTNYYLVEAQQSSQARSQAAAQIGGGMTGTAFGNHVSVSSEPDGQELRFSGTARNPATAANYANAFAQAFSNVVADQQTATKQAQEAAIQAQVTALQTKPQTAGVTAEMQALLTQESTVAIRANDEINIIAPAVKPTTPVSPKPKEDAALAFLVALLLGLGAAYALSSYTDRYRSADEVSRETGVPLLAEIPFVAVSEPAGVEAFQSLRAALEFVAETMDRPAFVITSAQMGAGKTHVVSNLAGALAAGERQVVLVDGDLRRPAVHERLGLAREPGFGDLLARHSGSRRGRGDGPGLGSAGDGYANGVADNRFDPAGSTNGNGQSAYPAADPVEVGARNLDTEDTGPASSWTSVEVITAGAPVGDAANALASAATGRVVAALKRSYELVLIDSPPMELADATLLARVSDGIILVVDARHDRRSGVIRVVSRLRSLDLPIVGFVFNGTAVRDRAYAYYGTQTRAKSHRMSRRGRAVATARRSTTYTPKLPKSAKRPGRTQSETAAGDR